jgi:UDP-GlcNAc:undecaprenyl-phosphate/decaprenyl-phosphate GlcNAc-1-phosphate transferase
VIAGSGSTAAIAFGASLALTPVVRRLALACGATDVPDARRVHTRITARAGGFAVIVAASVAVASAGMLPAAIGPLVLAGALLLLGVGLIDDVHSMRAGTKLGAQLCAAGMAVLGGLRFHAFGTDPGLLLGIADAALTTFWIVFITNAFNLTDGLDGLASGIATFAFLSLAATGVRAGDPAATSTALALAAALLGFLPYNFNPATIFLGDTGSLVLGYALAVLPLAGIHGSPLPPLAAMLLVALPATDTFIAIARRFLSRCLRAWSEGPVFGGLLDGLKNTMSPDRRHIHHRLLDLGLSQRRAVLLLYMASTSTSGLAYLVTGSLGWPIDLFALGLGIVVIGLVRALGFDELQPARSGLVLPVVRRVARHGWVVVTTDLALVTIAYASAMMLTGVRAHAFDMGLAIWFVAGAQLIVFALLGVYRTAWSVTEVSGFGLLLRACAAGSVAGYMGLRVLELPTEPGAMLVHAVLMLTAVTLTRFSQVLLKSAARDAAAAEPALIYGTATEGRQALHRLRRSGLQSLRPIGFIEFRSRMQGRELGRLPVLGSLDRLPGIVRERQPRHLVIADPGLRGEALDWVRAVCRRHDVHVHRYVERLVPYDGRVPTPTDLAQFRTTGPVDPEHLWRRPRDRRAADGASSYANGNGRNGNGAAPGSHPTHDGDPRRGPHGADS